MQFMRGIPTAPNSPAYSRAVSLDPPGGPDAADHAADHAEFSDFDMMSSIDSLPREPWPRAGPAGDAIDSASSSVQSASALASTALASTALAHHGFIMPSLPSLCDLDDSATAPGLVGRLNVVACGGPSRTKLIDVLCGEVFEPPRPPLGEPSLRLDPACLPRVCSSSRHEHNNITLIDCSVPRSGLAAWLEAQFRLAADSARQPEIDAVIYVIEHEPSNDELETLAQLQRFATIVPVVPARDPATEPVDTDGLLTRLKTAGFAPFLKRVWTVATELSPNYDMTASAVEGSLYSARILPSSELLEFAGALLGASGRARAHTTQLYARWVQAQLAVTAPEPPGALVVRVNLRKSLESINNLDPLGLANWCTMPRLVGAVLAGMAAAVGLSAAWSKLFPVVPAPPAQCHRHLSFDNVLDSWSQWLQI